MELAAKAAIACLLGVGLVSVGKADETFQCVRRLVLPVYSPLARTPGISGSVQFRAQITKNGLLDAIQSTGPDLLVGSVASAMNQSLFRSECNGQIVRFEFVFALEGKPSSFASGHVEFEPPHRFRIVARPPELNVDKGRR